MQIAGIPGKVRFGVIGLGFGASRCALLQEAPQAQLVAVAARHGEKARAIAQQYSVAAYTDYHEMLARDDIDAVAIYTQPNTHLDIAVAAAQAGKHLLITKPMETTLERFDKITGACRDAAVKVASEYPTRYLSSSYTVWQAIHSGAFGRIILGEFTEKLYRNQAYYDSNGGWRGRQSDGGGVMLNNAIHSADLMLWMMGEAATVTARSGRYGCNIQAEDTALALVTFKSGALGMLVGTTTFHNDRPPGDYGGGYLRRSEINGQLGSATVYSNRDGADEIAMWKLADGQDQVELVQPPASNVFQDFARWVLDDAYDSPTLVKAQEARRSLELIVAVYESARTGKTVALPMP